MNVVVIPRESGSKKVADAGSGGMSQGGTAFQVAAEIGRLENPESMVGNLLNANYTE